MIGRIYFKSDRKYCGKRRKCALLKIYPFTTSFLLIVEGKNQQIT